jgi:hypothetical protein
MSCDSSSMDAITILTMVFLPATFVSGVFISCAMSSCQALFSYNVSSLMLPYLNTVVPFTLLVVLFYIFRVRLYEIIKWIWRYGEEAKEIKERASIV